MLDCVYSWFTFLFFIRVHLNVRTRTFAAINNLFKETRQCFGNISYSARYRNQFFECLVTLEL